MLVCSSNTLAFISMPGGYEWIIILVIGLLLFGKRLPEIGRSVGKTIVEFKKGMADIDNETTAAAMRPAPGSMASPSAGELPGGTVQGASAERRVSTHDSVER
jgi:sec-independent protein translocase protein TatA